MKTGVSTAAPVGVAPIVELAGLDAGGGRADAAAAAAAEPQVLARARAFCEPLLSGQLFDTGEDALAHADGVSDILAHVGAGPTLRAASYLVYAGDYLNKPEETITKAFGTDEARLVMFTRRLVQVQRSARGALGDELQAPMQAEQLERVRKMLLAFSRDLRVVLLRLASRLQTLRYYARTKHPCPRVLAQESLQVFAPLANRLGIWQIKWELEDLSFRFLEPVQYQQVARLLDAKRVEREDSVEAVRTRVSLLLKADGLNAEVQGRPKHIYSIWKKMQGKGLTIDRVFDLRALRIIVDDVAACYGALACIHAAMPALNAEFDDYIARPKPNGYRSLHTVVLDTESRPVEIQIRTREMHEHAESGVAAHWAYKEAGAKGYAGVVAEGDFESRVAEARKAVLRQLLAWERDLAQDALQHTEVTHFFDDHIFVFTPQGTIIELPAGATPVDFAYAVHTDLGHRCRGAKVDGAMVPLNTALDSGQTVEIIALREGGSPSLDWINPELGYLRSHRAKAKVRAWFNAISQQQTTARGRDAVERLLQREGRTALKLEDLASQLGFRSADALFEVVGKDEYSLRNIESVLRPAQAEPDADELLSRKLSRGAPDPKAANKGGVLVVGVDSLLTQLARCCKPAPPDSIGGYVTRGKGVAVHRADCSNFRQMSGRSPERVIPVAWGARPGDALFAVDVSVEAADRPGLLRDVTEVFAKEKMHVTGMQSATQRHAHGAFTHMLFTVQIHDAHALDAALRLVQQISGVRRARRR